MRLNLDPRYRTFGAALLLAITLSPLSALAGETEADLRMGRSEYRTHCATCHGLIGRGAGPLEELLKKKAPSLSEIAKRRGGEFPETDTYEIIDGRRGLRSHGSQDMPIWGARYSKDALLLLEDIPHDVNPEKVVDDRIKRLLAYLKSIQVE